MLANVNFVAQWTLASNGQIGTLKGDGTTFASASIDSTVSYSQCGFGDNQY